MPLGRFSNKFGVLDADPGIAGIFYVNLEFGALHGLHARRPAVQGETLLSTRKWTS